MLDKHLEKVAKEIGVELKYVKNVVQLLSAENTVPFIARYYPLSSLLA
jgi:transcriptional accessory protein Tex/SPT6